MKNIKGKKTAINFLSLASVEMLNFIFPLITMPYLIGVLGIANYGLNSFVQAVMQYFIIITNYGFNITATQAISRAKGDKGQITRIYSSVMVCKTILLFLCLLVLTVMVLFIPKMQQNPLYYYLMFGIVVGSVLLPVWFFQGIEEMKSIGILNFLSKLIFTMGLFVFVKGKEDLYNVAIMNSLGYLTVGVSAVLIVRNKYDIRFFRPSFQEVSNQFKNSWYLFLSTLSTSIYNTTNIFVLGLIAGDAATGAFNIANTVIRVCANIASPIVQTFYPKVTQLITESKEAALKMIHRIWLLVTIVFITGCLILLFCVGPILKFFFGHQFDDSIMLIQIMSFLPLMVAWSNVYGVLTMTTFGYNKELSKIYLVSGIISLASIIMLTMLFGAKGTAINAFIVETIVTCWMFVFLKNRKINVAKGKFL